MDSYHTKVLFVSHPDSVLHDQVTAFCSAAGIELVQCSLTDFLPSPEQHLQGIQHLVAACSDAQANSILDVTQHFSCSVGLLPTEPHSRLYNWFQLPRDPQQLIELAFQRDSSCIDALRCNDELVLGMVMLGETPFLDRRSKAYLRRDSSRLKKYGYWLALLWASIRNLALIKPFAVTLTTAKEQTISTVITGMVAIEHDIQAAPARLINTSMSVQDGQLSTIFIAPKSITEYLAFLLAALFASRRAISRLPTAISYIKSQAITLTAQQPMAYFIDGQRRSNNSLKLVLIPGSLHINMGGAQQETKPVTNHKETLRVENLPTNTDRLAFIQQHLPLFTRALEDDFRDLFLILRDNAQTAPHYIIMMVLSVIVASFGLFLSSAAVIIGAMVLAPLMAPIISLSMGLLRQNNNLLHSSIRSILLGIALALSTAALLALLIPIQKVTPEMAGRLHPNLLDLGVAIASGIAGGYAHARESVMKSLPGVAIAVALVPPLSVAGIGIGWWDWSMFSGAMLLFMTNLVGIAMAAALTFLVLGYAPLLQAKKGLALTLAVLITLTIPLSLGFKNMYQRWQIESYLSQTTFTLIDQSTARLLDPQVSLQRKAMHLHADILSGEPISLDNLKLIQKQLEQHFQRPVSLEFSPRLSLSSNSSH